MGEHIWYLCWVLGDRDMVLRSDTGLGIGLCVDQQRYWLYLIPWIWIEFSKAGKGSKFRILENTHLWGKRWRKKKSMIENGLKAIVLGAKQGRGLPCKLRVRVVLTMTSGGQMGENWKQYLLDVATQRAPSDLHLGSFCGAVLQEADGRGLRREWGWGSEDVGSRGQVQPWLLAVCPMKVFMWLEWTGHPGKTEVPVFMSQQTVISREWGT